MSDALLAAPENVKESLAHILIGKLFRKPIPARHHDRFRRFLSRRDTLETLERVKRERGRKRLLPPAGEVYDLIPIFEEINLKFFHGLMARPEIGWSPGRSRWVLGHYDAAHHAIVISRILDHALVPPFVVEYVMYHEMLHLRFPVERRGARRCVHSAEFRQAEEQFPQYREAVEWIRTMGKVLPPGR